MGRSKRTSGLANGHSQNPVASTSTKNVTYTASELLGKAEAILAESNDLQLALRFADRAASNKDELNPAEKVKLHEILGLCAMEAGAEDNAKEFFTACEGKSSVALLYLAQLADSPEESLANYKAAVDLLSQKIDLASEPHGKDKLWTPEERENRLQITRALVGMTELYLTDLCMEDDAEARCIEYLDLAVKVDGGADMNPEIYSTLASVRLSQQKDEEALANLRKSYNMYREALLGDPDIEHPATPLIPQFEARMNVIRLFVECESYEEALEVLESCEEENDEEPEVLYLLGLINWSLGEGATEEEAKRDAYIDAREACARFLKVAAKSSEDINPEMQEQVEDLIKRIEEEKKVTMKDVQARDADTGDAPTADDWEDVSDEEMS